jgi:hypothetical protein
MTATTLGVGVYKPVRDACIAGTCFCVDLGALVLISSMDNSLKARSSRTTPTMRVAMLP